MKNFMFGILVALIFTACNEQKKMLPPVPIHFIATRLINFDLPYLQYGNPPGSIIDVSALHEKEAMALHLLDSVVNTQQFRDAVLSADFKDKRGLSNAQIYDTFVSNAPNIKAIRENLILEIDTTKLWNVTYQAGNHPTIGYDNTINDKTVNTVQLQLVNNLSAADYAAHIAHEYCHMLGFEHPEIIFRNKLSSVPYTIQSIIEDKLNINKSNINYIH